MLTDARIYRKNGDKLNLTNSLDKIQPGEWEIVDMVGEGSSAVCYSAVHLGKIGRLKEYSPINTANPNIEDFVGAYKTLDDLKCHNPNFEIINNYIPHYEIMYECDSDGQPFSAFIWTPDDKKGTTFEQYVSDISAEITVGSEKKLYDILSVTATLADCICLIHMAGLLHLDIKPSNFLVTYNSRKEINAGNISLFDINTLYSIESDFSNVVGTMGFCAPEVGLGCPDNRADIYSIGAMLFSVIMKTGPEAYRLYDDSMFENLSDIIRSSKLISCSAINSAPEALNMLCHIFEKTLASDRNKRYDYCEQLQKDVEDLLLLLSKSAYSEAPERARGRKKSKKGKFVKACASFAAVAAVAAGVILWANYPKTDVKVENDQLSTENETQISDENDDASGSEVSIVAVEACSAETAFKNMRALIDAAGKSFKAKESYVIISPETVGNSLIYFSDDVEIPSGVTVEFTDEMRFVFKTNEYDQCYDITNWGTLKMNTDYLTESLTYDQAFYVNFEEGSSLYTNGFSISFDNPHRYNIWKTGTLGFIYRGGKFVRYIEFDGRVKVSCDYDTFIEEGFSCIAGVIDEGVKELYFADSDEAFISVEPGNFEYLQNMMWDNPGEYYVDYPVVIDYGRNLFLGEGNVIHIVKGGSITVRKDSYLYADSSQLLLEGGEIIYE